MILILWVGDGGGDDGDVDFEDDDDGRHNRIA